MMKKMAPDNVEITCIDNDFSGQLGLLKESLRLEVINRSGNKQFSWSKVFHRVLTNPGRRFYFWWRIASFMHRTQNPRLKRYSRKINSKLCRKYSIDIALDAEIGPGMKINHGYGIVIRPECVIGKRLNIRHGVTIGRKSNGDTKGKTVIGDVTIGHNVVIGAGSFVNKNIPDNVIVCNPRPLSIRERSAS